MLEVAEIGGGTLELEPDNLALICFGSGGLVRGLLLLEFSFSLPAICLASSEDFPVCDFPPVGLVDGSMAAQAGSFSSLELELDLALAACFDFDDWDAIVSGLLFLEALALAILFPFFSEEMDDSLSLSLPVVVAVSPLAVLVALRTAGVIVTTPALPLLLPLVSTLLVVPVQSGDEFLGVENFSDMRKEAQS